MPVSRNNRVPIKKKRVPSPVRSVAVTKRKNRKRRIRLFKKNLYRLLFVIAILFIVIVAIMKAMHEAGRLNKQLHDQDKLMELKKTK